MNPENELWESIKAEYLHQVEKALSSVNHPRRKDVLDDVRSHLERRFAELSSDQRTWENFQAIIADMGPPSDYVELLDSKQKAKTEKLSPRFVILVAIIFAAVAGVMIIFPLVYHRGQQTFELQESPSRPLPHPFTNDPEILGDWESVDFVEFVDEFQPGARRWEGELFVKKLTFLPNGRISKYGTWTKGWIYDDNSKTRAQYKIETLSGRAYLFFPWLNSDVAIRRQDPHYYVLKKVSAPEKIQE